MQTEPRFTFRGFDPSPSLRELIEERVATLERMHPRIITCDVVVEMPHRRHAHGNHWRVRVSVAVPGDEIVVAHEREPGDRHTDPSATVRDAFDAAERQLQDHARRASGRIKHHEGAPAARVLALGPDHGFLETATGRQLYFHANAVLDGRFAELIRGVEVEYVEEDGLEGPQASTVRLLS
jgi:ribosome-associated translation inhibitor RaiA/cold shock CspA family protein